jgi:hypothetical protein
MTPTLAFDDSPNEPVYIPTPWVDGPADTVYTQGGVTSNANVGVIPENYAIVPLLTKVNPASGSVTGDAAIEPIPIDADIEIDNTKGYVDGQNVVGVGSGDGFWPVAYGCTDGTSETSDVTTSRQTLNDAISSEDGRSKYNINNVSKFEGFKAYEIEKISVYGIVIGTAGALGTTSPKYPGYNMSLDQYDFNLDIETIQKRYQ